MISGYLVGEKLFRNKFEAIDAARGTAPKFYFQDEIWAKQDWLAPPDVPLRELYRARAEQLRSKYDYIILAYSGGADSWNVLKTFDDAGIFLDEIVSYHDYGFTGDRLSKASSEIFTVAEPVALDYVKRVPNSRFTLIDAKPLLLDVWARTSAEELLSGYYVSPVSPLSPIRGGCFMHGVDRYQKLLESGKRVCLLWGFDKVHLKITDGRYCFQFIDYISQAYAKSHLPVTDEFFYFSTDLPALLIKSCHQVKSFLDRLPGKFIDPYPINLKAKKVAFQRSKTGHRVSFTTINALLYGWNPATFSEGRFGGSPFLSEQDFWVLDHLSDPLVQKWATVVKMAANYYKKAGVSSPIFSSRPYFIE